MTGRSILRRGDHPVHPLKAWRLTQRYYHARHKKLVPMTASEAARRVGATPIMWTSWEKYPGEAGAAIPTYANMIKIYELTGGHVRPDHFYMLSGEKRRVG